MMLSDDGVKHLPVEDTIWLIDHRTQEDENGEKCQCLVLKDTNRRIIGYKDLKSSKDIIEQCHVFISSSCMAPLVGKPRRPKSIAFKAQTIALQVTGLELSDLGIRLLSAGQKQEGVHDLCRMRECCVCGIRGSRELFTSCPSCKAMLYCSSGCQDVDWAREGPMFEHSHQVWCNTMKGYMDKTQELRQLPFTFTEETTSEDFDETAYHTFLKKQGVYNLGYWKREVTQQPLHAGTQGYIPYDPDETAPTGAVSSGSSLFTGEIWEVEDGVVLPVESCILDQPPDNPPACIIDSWESYYQYRGFRLDSPVAVLLQWPLTLYHVISACLPVDYPGWSAGIDGSTVVVDIVGVEKEVEMLPLFIETGHLLGDLTLDIQMFGTEISKSVHQKQWEACNVKIKVIRGLYHKKADKGRRPHLLLGFNAGLGAYPTWKKTLEKLKEDRMPTYFTDFCQYSCECAKTAIKAIGLGTVSNPIINPYRSPIRKLADENDMPWYSNGFLYHISYPP